MDTLMMNNPSRKRQFKPENENFQAMSSPSMDAPPQSPLEDDEFVRSLANPTPFLNFSSSEQEMAFARAVLDNIGVDSNSSESEEPSPNTPPTPQAPFVFPPQYQQQQQQQFQNPQQFRNAPQFQQYPQQFQNTQNFQNMQQFSPNQMVAQSSPSSQRFQQVMRPIKPEKNSNNNNSNSNNQEILMQQLQQFGRSSIPQELRAANLTIRVLDTEYYPYPRFWIKTYHLRPSVTLVIENCNSNLNNLIVLAVPVDPDNLQPLSNARLESAAEVINEELTNELQPRYGCPAVRFADMKIIGDRTLSSKQGNDILLSFVLLSKHQFPPVPVTQFVCPTKIRVYNRFNELPAPNIVKVVPNVITCNQTQEVTVYGQLFKKGKGVTCGIINLGSHPSFSHNSLNETFPPYKNPPPQVVKVTSEYSTFTFPLCNPYEGFTLINASNDQIRYGLGKLIYFQKAPTYQPDVNYSGFSQDGNRPGSGNNDPSNPDRRGPNSGNSGSGGNDGNMSFDAAAFFGNFNQLQNLLSQGTPINQTDVHGNTALYWASWNGKAEIVGHLLRNGADVHMANRNTKETPLHVASRNGHVAIVQMLIKFGANANATNSTGSLPLHLAATDGHLEVVKVLVTVTENINVSDKDDFTALHLSVMRGFYKVSEFLAKELSDNCLSLNKKDSFGYTPLHWSVTLNNPEILQCLLEYGADTNKLDFQGESPLFIAVRNSDETCVETLLENGAKTELQNKDNQPPVFFAQTAKIRAMLLQFKQTKTSNPVVVIQAAPVPVQVESRKKDELSELKEKNRKLEEQVHKLMSQLHLADNLPAISSKSIVRDDSGYADVSEEASESVSSSWAMKPTADDEEEEEEEEEEDILYKVKQYGSDKILGEIMLPPDSTLNEAREVIFKELNKPFTFYWEKLKSFVEERYEKKVKADTCGEYITIQLDNEPTSEAKDSVPKETVSKETISKETSEIRGVPHSEDEGKALDGDDEPVDTATIANEFWNSQFHGDGVVAVDKFIAILKKSFPPRVAELDLRVVDIGLNDFFGTLGSQKQGVTQKDLSLFLKVFGPLERCLQRVVNVYREPYFYGFLTFDEAKVILKNQPGGFLIRYSQSLLHKGCYVLNVNKGRRDSDLIENYVIRYHPQFEKFIFYNRPYDTLRHFIEDPIYGNILKQAVAHDNNKFVNTASVVNQAVVV